MERFNRAERIAQAKRLKRNRKDYWWRGDKTPRQIGMLASTCRIHSNCRCCCNPRRGGEMTMQERSFEQQALHAGHEGWEALEVDWVISDSNAGDHASVLMDKWERATEATHPQAVDAETGTQRNSAPPTPPTAA